MSRLLLLLAFVFLAPFAGAQEKESKDTLNRKAVEALQAKKFDEGIALLMKILETNPNDKDTAYNLACAYSLKAEPDKAFEWLDKMVAWGWGVGTGRIVGIDTPMSHVEMLQKDPDFENLRKDPRWEKLLAGLAKADEERAARKKKGEEYAATAAIYVPEKAKGLAEMPVLVVLHDAGSTKDAVVAGRWKEIADELGFALIAPSGKILVGEEAEKGMTWIDDFEAYKLKYWTFEKPATDAISAFKKDHPLDKNRVVIAGEGVGALVALNTAIGNPGLIKGAVALNGGVNAELMAAKAPTAGKMGLRVRILFEGPALAKLMTDGDKKAEDGEKLVAAWSKSLQTWGIAGEVKMLPADAAGTKTQIVEAIRAVLERDAAAPKPEAPKEPAPTK